MSAMHWEARRRRSALDRRMARDKQLLQMRAETSCNTTEPNSREDPPAGSLCPHCKRDVNAPVDYSAIIPNRSTSLKYAQQW